MYLSWELPFSTGKSSLNRAMASKFFHFVNHTKLPEGRVLNQLWNNMVLDNETFFFCSVLWQPAAEQGAEFSAPCCSSWWVDRHGDALHWLKLKIAGCRNFRSHFRFWTSMKMGTSNQWGRKWWIPRWWCVFSASHQLIASAMCLWQSKPWRSDVLNHYFLDVFVVPYSASNRDVVFRKSFSHGPGVHSPEMQPKHSAGHDFLFPLRASTASCWAGCWILGTVL